MTEVQRHFSFLAHVGLAYASLAMGYVILGYLWCALGILIVFDVLPRWAKK